MHHSPVFGAVDGFPCKHRVTPLGHTTLAGQVQQQRFSGGVDQVLGQIGEHLRRLLAEVGKALGIGRKGGTQVEAVALRAVGLRQRGPGGRVVTPLHHHTASISCSSFTASAAKARIPSASFSVAMASALWA